ncbi:MAG TPA: 2-phosphosulfolactate phosphatase [Acidimicrobiia bacterium]|nr:2-phosphosulfolactate phosphatase [Acidimicrobiia bacterium]
MALIRRLRYLDGAAAASGATVVIDVFRAFTTAAFALDAGADRVVLAAGVDEARSLAHSIAGSLLAGEVDGARPRGFDLGNSPAEVMQLGPLDGRTMVLRSSAGTRALLAARVGGAESVLAGSLVVASATAGALAGKPDVTLVVSGWNGVEPAEEDEACADLILLVLGGDRPNLAQVRSRAAEGDGARRVASAAWADPDDLELCLEIDRFDFFMPSVTDGDRVALIAKQ